MMYDEEIGDILATSHGQPCLSSWVNVDKLVEVVEFILHNPIVGSITTPQLGISCFLFL